MQIMNKIIRQKKRIKHAFDIISWFLPPSKKKVSRTTNYKCTDECNKREGYKGAKYGTSFEGVKRPP